MNEKYVIDKIKEIEEEGTIPKEHTHTVSDISDMPSEFTPEAHGHAAAEITSGTLDAARIPALDAGKITSGTLAVARIPSLTASKISDFEAKVEEIAGGASGDITSTSITNSGTITSTGLITANGGVKGNLTGNVTGNITGIATGKLYVRAKTTTSKKNNDVTYATITAQSTTVTLDRYASGYTNSSTLTVGGYSKVSMSYPYQLSPGIYIPSSSYFTDTVPSSVSRTATLTVTVTSYSTNAGNAIAKLYVNGTEVTSVSRTGKTDGSKSVTYTVTSGSSVYFSFNGGDTIGAKATLSIAAPSPYYINVV